MNVTKTAWGQLPRARSRVSYFIALTVIVSSSNRFSKEGHFRQKKKRKEM